MKFSKTILSALTVLCAMKSSSADNATLAAETPPLPDDWYMDEGTRMLTTAESIAGWKYHSVQGSTGGDHRALDGSCPVIYEDAWSDGTLDPWIEANELLDNRRDSVKPAVIEASGIGPPRLRLQGKASCFSSPYNGVLSKASQSFSMPAGCHSISANLEHEINFYAFCRSGARTRSSIRVDGATIASRVIVQSGECGITADNEPIGISGEFCLASAATIEIELVTKASDCGAYVSWWDDISIQAACVEEWEIHDMTYEDPAVSLNEDLLEGDFFVEVHSDRIDGAAVPNLQATMYTVAPGQTDCISGTPVGGVAFNPFTPCTDPSCPTPEVGGVPVEMTYQITDPYNAGIWDPAAGANDGQFTFCVRAELMLDEDADGTLEYRVSFADIFIVVDVDYSVEFGLNVYTFDNNPGSLESALDAFRVLCFVCDGAEPYSNAFSVGQHVHICCKPETPDFADYEVAAFGPVTCENAGGETSEIIGETGAPRNELTEIDLSGSPIGMFETVVTTGLITPNDDNQFSCAGSLELALISNRRRAQELEGVEAAKDETLNGAFKVYVTFENPNRLSTGGIVGISVAIAVVFFLVVFILYRRGCFAKRKSEGKPPKTVMIDENSETTGDADENA